MKKQVLLVDEVLQASAAKTVLELSSNGNIKITCAREYSEAFREATSGKYDAVVMEPFMAFGDADVEERVKEEKLSEAGGVAAGLYLKDQIVKHFNEVAKEPPPKIIFHTVRKDRLKGDLLENVEECIWKPSDTDELIAAIDRHI